ncbi:hypothetical protein [Streptomyces sp. CAU 1734]|uniref:hypothetical protein n=1 Tax=Streptomyces sp. CAU 1734 TaxID=3140360 RepID=UPI003260EF47
MTSPAFPHRVRLYGGRNTHAARPDGEGQDRWFTACDYVLTPPRNGADHWLLRTEPVTCPACKRKTDR